MRVQLALALAATLVAGSTASAAQNSTAAAGNQIATAAGQKAETAKPRKAAKPAGDKVCRRLSQGKVCMTAEQWKAYEQIM